MKKLLLIVFGILLIPSLFILNYIVFASSNPDNDYTYIDCENWSDYTWTPFDSNKPYLSLKKWIESTVAYINSNWLSANSWKWLNYSWATFNIYVKPWCLYNRTISPDIQLNFISENKSTLNIKWQWWKFSVDNIYFNLQRNWVWNIVFDNVNFLRNDIAWFYFGGYNYGYIWYNSKPIKIKNSAISISTWKQFWYYNTDYNSRDGQSYTYRPGWYFIENSLIKIDINWNYDFRVPVFLKNNKIEINNVNTNWTKYNVWFWVAWKNSDWYNYWNINLVSNEINLWWNNFRTDNTYSTYINNKFTSVWTFIAWSDETSTKVNNFINNEIHATNQVNLSTNSYAFNNYIPNWFTDINNVNNFKKNFTSLTWNEKWIWWILNKELSSNVKIYEDYKNLYKEVTWNNFPSVENPTIFTIH